MLIDDIIKRILKELRKEVVKLPKKERSFVQMNIKKVLKMVFRIKES